MLRRKPPAIPTDLLERCGEPERVFAPNAKFRIVSSMCGIILLVVGSAFILLDKLGMPLSDFVSGNLAVPMLALGAALLIGARLVPLHWVFVSPRGLLRRRGDTWEHVDWADVARFEDATLGHKGITFQQCRIVTTSGQEWGFLADQTAEYSELAAVLRQKVAARNPISSTGKSSGA